ncbi:helix-turn-helix domain-containing protein [Paenibacillus sp. TRM 82003]|nr:helix-turn-helix domain-containing protein [Paenibacillus sp. TRM 82003]
MFYLNTYLYNSKCKEFRSYQSFSSLKEKNDAVQTFLNEQGYKLVSNVVKVLLHISQKSSNVYGVCWQQINHIADDVGVSVRTVERAVNKLMEFGILRKEIQNHKLGGRRPLLILCPYSSEDECETNVLVEEANAIESVDEPCVGEVERVDVESNVGSVVVGGGGAVVLTVDGLEMANVDTEPPVTAKDLGLSHDAAITTLTPSLSGCITALEELEQTQYTNQSILSLIRKIVHRKIRSEMERPTYEQLFLSLYEESKDLHGFSELLFKRVVLAVTRQDQAKIKNLESYAEKAMEQAIRDAMSSSLPEKGKGTDPEVNVEEDENVDHAQLAFRLYQDEREKCAKDHKSFMKFAAIRQISSVVAKRLGLNEDDVKRDFRDYLDLQGE